MGAAHLGVMRALSEWGITPTVCVGASAGGLVAGGLAAGVPLPDLTAFYAHVCAVPHWYELQAVAAEEWSAFTSGDRLGVATLAPALRTLTAHAAPTVAQWKPGYGVVTVDLAEEGGLCTLSSTLALGIHWTTAEALQATSALPGLFAGVCRDGGLYVDGGLQDNLPTGIACNLGADRVLSVNVGGSLPMPPLPARLTLAEVVQRAVAYGTATLTAESNTPQQLPVLCVNPPIPAGAGLLSFGDFAALVQAGYGAAVARRAEIEAFAAGKAAA